MKILLADRFPKQHLKALSDKGHIITYDPELEEDSLISAISDNEVLVLRSTKVLAPALDVATNLKLIIRAGTGTNTIDKIYASNKGIRVCNVPGANANAVAELVMGLIIAIDRHIVNNSIDLRQGVWNKKIYSNAKGLYGKSIGIFGLGKIGFAVAELASAFRMTVCSIEKNRLESAQERIESMGILQMSNQKELLNHADIVSLHVPATEKTRKMVNSSFLAEMKEGSILINASRGELIDEVALIDSMEKKGIKAGLDVYQNEPKSDQCEFHSDIARHSNVFGTHHIGASTEQAQTAVADGVIKIIQTYHQDGKFIHCVN